MTLQGQELIDAAIKAGYEVTEYTRDAILRCNFPSGLELIEVGQSDTTHYFDGFAIRKVHENFRTDIVQSYHCLCFRYVGPTASVQPKFSCGHGRDSTDTFCTVCAALYMRRVVA